VGIARLVVKKAASFVEAAFFLPPKSPSEAKASAVSTLRKRRAIAKTQSGISHPDTQPNEGRKTLVISSTSS
jgi:hypothetical protein